MCNGDQSMFDVNNAYAEKHENEAHTFEYEECPPTWEFAATIHCQVLLNPNVERHISHNAMAELISMGRKLDGVLQWIANERAGMKAEQKYIGSDEEETE